MDTLTKTELQIRQEEIAQRIDDGEVFIHPTDTIYGLGCDATNDTAVKRIRELKQRPDSPLSIWAPSKEWIKEFCEIPPQAEEWLDQLPGPYTLLLTLKKKHPLAKSVNPKNGSVGIRFPDHWFSQFVGALGVPLITTSANKTGEQFMTSIENLDPDVGRGVHFVVYEGEKKGKPSKIVNVSVGEVKER